LQTVKVFASLANEIVIIILPTSIKSQCEPVSIRLVTNFPEKPKNGRFCTGKL
jgi:hypothetical protein